MVDSTNIIIFLYNNLYNEGGMTNLFDAYVQYVTLNMI